MKQRIITGAVMAAIGIPILIFSDYIIYPIALSILAIIAVWELLGLTAFRKSIAVLLPSYIIVAALPIISYKVSSIEGALSMIIGLAASLFGYMIYLIGYAVVKRGKVKLADVSLFYVYFSYICLAFTSISLLRYIPNGVYYYILILLASWVCDIFAYFVGFAIGEHKLIPEVSPKKTVEGAVGGVFFATISCLVFGIIISYVSGAPKPNFLALATYGIILSIISQFGDLSASLLKREKGKKDFGNIFPGHGGVLDRFDSMLPVAPVLLALCMIWPPFC